MEEIKKSLNDAFCTTGKKLWNLIHEISTDIINNNKVVELSENDKLLFDKVFNILDLIKDSDEYKYKFDILHDCFSGYHTTITMTDRSKNTRQATDEDIAIGIYAKDTDNFNPMVVWQIYLFCKFFRFFDTAGSYYGMPIFDLSDINVSKFETHDELDKEDIEKALKQLDIAKESLLPNITAVGNSEHEIFKVTCTWWFPFTGLVQETIEYERIVVELFEMSNYKNILIPYKYYKN